jgi:phage gp29-like protein
MKKIKEVKPPRPITPAEERLVEAGYRVYQYVGWMEIMEAFKELDAAAKAYEKERKGKHV